MDLKTIEDGIESSHNNVGSRIAHITAPADSQDVHVIHHHPNFFVLAPSPQKQSRIALEEMEVGLVDPPTVRLKYTAPRNTLVLTKPPSDEVTLDVVEEQTTRDEPVDDIAAANTLKSPTIDLVRIASQSTAILKKVKPARSATPPQSTPVPDPSEEIRPGIVARMNSLKLPKWLETILVFGILAASFATHAINMFNYPHYEQDEGTYMMYAWAVTRGAISPYAYGYGHPPLAWMQIAGWVELTGGFSAFGNALNSGRVLMLLMAVVSTLLVYLIARHLGASFVVSLLGVAFFALSPLSVTFQREVLLDNFAAFWFLVSLYLIVRGKSHLFYIVAAAISFGISLLSKEVIIILFPVMIYVVWLYTTKFQRKFTVVTFTYIVIAIGSGFVLMAALKNELFPYSWHLPWDHHPHLSLVDTYLVQVGRGQQQGSIKASWKAWVQGDPLLILIGFAAPAFNFLTGWWNRKGLFLAIFAALYWLLLLRGGVVFAFYIIPLIPIIALNVVFALVTLSRWLTKLVRFNFIGIVLVTCVLAALIPYGIQHSRNPYNVYTLRPAIVQNEGIVWIRAHVPRRAVLVVSSNLFVDLHDSESEGVGAGAPYPYAHVYWFMGLDPALHVSLLRNNWDRIDYLVLDAEMLNDIQTYGGDMQILDDALNHSVLRVEFKGDNNEFLRIYQVMHKQPPPQP